MAELLAHPSRQVMQALAGKNANDYSAGERFHMQKETSLKIIIGIITFILVLSSIACSSIYSNEVEIVDIDGDGLISLPQELPGAFPTLDPEKNFVQKVTIVQDLLAEEHIQCTFDYNGMQGNSPWVSKIHPSLSSVYALRLDNNGNMWVSTAGDGIAMFNGEEWRQWSWDSNPPLPYDEFPGLDAAEIIAIAGIDYEPVTGEKPVTELNHKGAILVYDEMTDSWKDTEAPFNVGKNDDNMPGLAVNDQGEIFVPFNTLEIIERDEEQSSDREKPGIINLLETVFNSDTASEPEVTTKGNLGIYSNGEWEIKDMPTIPLMGMNDAEIDSKGNYWVATNGAGVWMYNGQDWQIFSSWQGQLPWDNVTGIAETEEGFFWASTPTGIALLSSNGTSIVLSKEDYPLGNEALEDIAIDGENRLWILSDDQVSIYNGQEWASLRPRGAGPPKNWSYNIAFDSDGCGWIVFSGGSMAQIFRNQINMNAGDYSEIINAETN